MRWRRQRKQERTRETESHDRPGLRVFGARSICSPETAEQWGLFRPSRRSGCWLWSVKRKPIQEMDGRVLVISMEEKITRDSSLVSRKKKMVGSTNKRQVRRMKFGDRRSREKKET
ncbi:hypothetical protein ElyMa_005999100 [Elysia marginata]|uniref:Uncharacterized protein n=1 Tax=Elysia marginata TaxID=1093978 RepID=A0AAV4GF76_9GAST|nr:hypothetical protein ElyMa_005999100 [Elysia marginata]